MKKRLSLVLAVLGFCAAANATVWNFENGLSAETVAAITADEAGWALQTGKMDEYEVGDAKLISRHNATTWAEAAPLTAGGAELKEFAGLKFIAEGADAIRIGAQTTQLCTDFGFTPGTISRLRVTNKAKLILPAMKAGDKVTIKWCSAKPKDKDTGRYPSSEQWTAIEGVPGSGAAADYTSQTMFTITYQINDDVTEPTEIVVDIVKSGIDIFSIETDGGNDVEEAKKVAFVGGAEDYAASVLDAARLDVTPISPDDEVSLADLQGYEAVIVSNTVAADAKIVPVLKSAIAYQPMVNFNAALYEAWGLGKATVSESQSVTVTEAFAADETFASIANGDALLMDGMLSTIELGDYFADDAVVATIDGKVAIHRHNAGRNTYINVPMTAECMPTFDAATVIFTDLAVYAAKTKRDVVATTAPKIEQKNGDMETTVTITAAAGSVIHYTLDESEPTVESPVYTEPLVLTEAKTVKAIAELDGYLPSAVASAEVIIMSKVATPTFHMTQDDAATTIEIECATPDAAIYYSYREFTDTVMAQRYVGPITLSQEPTPIYAMAGIKDAVLSDLASDYVAIKSLNKNTIRMDTVSHFSAIEAAWKPTEDRKPEGYAEKSNVNYYWGRSAWDFSADKKEFYPNEGNGMENDWKIVSQGQVMGTQCKDAPQDGVGDGSDGKTLAGRYGDTAEDLIGGLGTKGYTQFGAVNKAADETNQPYSGSIESANGFDAPYDIVVIAGNNSGGSRSGEIQTSTDGQTWEKLTDLKVSKANRYIKRTRASIEGTGKVYVRLANVSQNVNIYDIYILNHGEVSEKYDPTSGIEDVEVAEVEVVRTEIYNISGMLMPEMIQGINIVRTYYSDGSVKTTKVLNR